MKIRRNTILGTMGNAAEQKAVVLLMLLKDRLGKCSVIREASINKIAKVAGVSPSTVKKYMPLWVSMKLVEWQGAAFVVKRLCSKTRHRNMDVEGLDFGSFKKLYDSFRAFLFMVKQSHKDFLKRVLRIAHDPHKGEDYKEARVYSRRYAKGGLCDVYHEWGISYRCIGRFLGFCTRTAEKIVKIAQKLGFCKKNRHFERTYMPGVNGMYVEGYTFTTKNYGYVVMANTYTRTRKLTW